MRVCSSSRLGTGCSREQLSLRASVCPGAWRTDHTADGGPDTWSESTTSHSHRARATQGGGRWLRTASLQTLPTHCLPQGRLLSPPGLGGCISGGARLGRCCSTVSGGSGPRQCRRRGGAGSSGRGLGHGSVSADGVPQPQHRGPGMAWTVGAASTRRDADGHQFWTAGGGGPRCGSRAWLGFGCGQNRTP